MKSKLPSYIAQSVETSRMAQAYLHRFVDLMEKHEGRTPDSKEVHDMAVEFLKGLK